MSIKRQFYYNEIIFRQLPDYTDTSTKILRKGIRVIIQVSILSHAALSQSAFQIYALCFLQNALIFLLSDKNTESFQVIHILLSWKCLCAGFDYLILFLMQRFILFHYFYDILSFHVFFYKMPKPLIGICFNAFRSLA